VSATRKKSIRLMLYAFLYLKIDKGEFL